MLSRARGRGLKGAHVDAGIQSFMRRLHPIERVGCCERAVLGPASEAEVLTTYVVVLHLENIKCSSCIVLYSEFPSSHSYLI